MPRRQQHGAGSACGACRAAGRGAAAAHDARRAPGAGLCTSPPVSDPPCSPAQAATGRAYHARISMPMQAQGAANSSACLAERSCQPLGGFNVWAALPPLPAGEAAGRVAAGRWAGADAWAALLPLPARENHTATARTPLEMFPTHPRDLPPGRNVTKPTILVVAQLDGFDLFHDSIQVCAVHAGRAAGAWGGGCFGCRVPGV